jgi:hypothetical protein
MQRKLTVPQQFELSFRLAQLIGWRNITGRGSTLAGEPPFRGERRYERRIIPNYFDPEGFAGRAELIRFITGAPLDLKVCFVQAFDHQITGGRFTSSLTAVGCVDDVLHLLDASPARVAWALVEAAGLELEELRQAA